MELTFVLFWGVKVWDYFFPNVSMHLGDTDDAGLATVAKGASFPSYPDARDFAGGISFGLKQQLI
jgi:hypothetical protein